MKGSPAIEQIVASLADLESDADRRRFVESRRGQISAPVVERLCDLVVAELGADLDRAARLAEAALVLAESLQDDYCRGRGHRAMSIVHSQRREHVRALQQAEDALDAFERAGDRKEAAITRSSALHCLSHLGQHDRAMEWALLAADTFDRLGDRLRLARLELNCGTMLARRDLFKEALGHYRRAHEEFQAVGRARDVAIALRNIAVTLQCDFRLGEALAAYERARAYCAAHDLPRLVVEIDYNFAYLHYLRGEYAKALGLFEASRRHCLALGDRQHTALCDLETSEIYLELNLPSEAEELARQALAEFEALSMGYEAAKCLTNLALTAARKGENREALELLERARMRFAAEKNRVWPVILGLYRSHVLMSGGGLDEAERHAASALEAFEQLALPSRAALCRIQLARLALERRDWRRAQELCASALADIAELELPAVEFRARVVNARAEEGLGRREAAVAAFRRAESLLERLRSHLRTDEMKISFLHEKLEVYESLVVLALEPAGEQMEIDDPALCSAVFADIEKSKSRGLIDLLASGAASLPAKKTGDELAATLRRLRSELSGLYRQIDLAETRGSEVSKARLDELRRTSRRKEHELLGTSRRLQSADPEFSALQQSAPIASDEIRATLPPNAVMLEYFIAHEEIFVCRLCRTELRIYRLGPASEARKLIRALHYQLSKLQLDPRYVERFATAMLRDTRRHLRALHDALVAPVLDGVSAEELIVVPHGFLHYLPFHALDDGTHYLVDRFDVSYAPSAGAYMLCRRKPAARGEHALVLGAADERAPLIRREARTVASTVPEAVLLLDEEANEENLRLYGEHASVIHVAAHGLFRRDNPMFSSIQLGSGRLSLFDLFELQLEADLVVLSGCSTGMSDVQSGDELVGLSRGLFYAGARAVAVTLWDVDDESTSELMRLFYAALGSGEKADAALRQAMTALRRRWPHPYHWAPFCLIGDTSVRPQGGGAERAGGAESSPGA